MAAAQIPIATNGAPVWASKFFQFRTQLGQLRDLGRELKGKMGACVDGSSYAPLEVQFGLTSNGQTDTSSVGYSAKYQLEQVMACVDSSSPPANPAVVVQQFLDQVG